AGPCNASTPTARRAACGCALTRPGRNGAATAVLRGTTCRRRWGRGCVCARAPWAPTGPSASTDRSLDGHYRAYLARRPSNTHVATATHLCRVSPATILLSAQLQGV